MFGGRRDRDAGTRRLGGSLGVRWGGWICEDTGAVGADALPLVLAGEVPVALRERTAPLTGQLGSERATREGSWKSFVRGARSAAG